jgi:hypothetical protein
MTFFKKILISVITTILFSTIVFSSEIDANAIVKKADLRRGLGNVSHSFNVTITNQDNKREVYHVIFKDINSSLTEQTEPERARGRKILMKDYDIWLYTPNIKKPLRISLEQKLTGEVSNGDIARTNYGEDYDASLISIEKKGDAEFYKLDLKAKNKKVTYGHIEYWVSRKDFAQLEATFFALSGKPLKSAQFMDFKPVQGMSRTTKMVIRDYLQKDKMSTMVFSDHRPEKFDESLFNKDRLEF